MEKGNNNLQKCFKHCDKCIPTLEEEEPTWNAYFKCGNSADNKLNKQLAQTNKSLT